MTGNDITSPHVTGSDVILPEVNWKWLWKAKNFVLCTFQFLQGCNSQEVAVTRSDVISSEVTTNRLWKAKNSDFVYV